MDYRKLSHFIVLAKERHFSRAADKVHLTQPAFSRSIQTLEHQLGATLVDRQTPELKLTPVGKLVLSRAKELVLDLESLKREVDLALGCEIGSVRIGTGPFPSETLVPQVVATLLSQHPGMEIEVKVNKWARLLQHLYDEEIELVVADARDTPPDPRLDIQPLTRQMIAFACRPDHPLLKHARLRPAELLEYPFATPSIPEKFMPGLYKVLKVADRQFAPTAVLDNPRLLVEVAKNSDAVVMSTYAAIQNEITGGSLQTLKLPHQALLFVDMSIVTLAKRELSPGAKWLRRNIVLLTAALAKSNPGWWKAPSSGHGTNRKR